MRERAGLHYTLDKTICHKHLQRCNLTLDFHAQVVLQWLSDGKVSIVIRQSLLGGQEPVRRRPNVPVVDRAFLSWPPFILTGFVVAIKEVTILRCPPGSLQQENKLMDFAYKYDTILKQWEIFTLSKNYKLSDKPVVIVDNEASAVDIMNFLDGREAQAVQGE